MLSVEQKSNEKKSRPIIIFITLLVSILLVGLSIIFYLAFQDDNQDRRYNTPSSELVTKLAYSALLEKEIVIQNDEINGFIAKQIEQNNFEERIKAINIKTEPDSSYANIYAYLNYKGINLGSIFDTEIALNQDGKVKFNIIRAKVGKLPVPRHFALNILKETMGDTIKIQDTTVFTDSKFSLNVFNTEITLTIDKLEFKNGQFILKFSGGMDALKKVLGDNFDRVLSLIRK